MVYHPRRGGLRAGDCAGDDLCSDVALADRCGLVREAHHDHRPRERGRYTATVRKPEPSEGCVPSALCIRHAVSVPPDCKRDVIVR
jgi:hypothetical protein